MALARDEAALDEAKRQVEAALLPGARRKSTAPRPRCGRRARSSTSSTSASAAKRSVAPAAGVVQDVFFRAGEMVNAGQPVL